MEPRPPEDVLDAAASADAADLLRHILSQPDAEPPSRPPVRSRRPAAAWIAAAAAIAVAAAGIGLSATLPGDRSTHAASSGSPVIGFLPRTSQGLATNAVKLVDYATRAAALTPAFVPGPHEWMYRDVRQINSYFGPRGYREVTWWEVNFHQVFVLDRRQARL